MLKHLGFEALLEIELYKTCTPRWGERDLAAPEHFLKFSCAKFAPRCGKRAIRKSKSLKTGSIGALFEVELRKVCTTLWRESDLEVKTVKTPGARDVFGGSKCVLRGRRRSSWGLRLRNVWNVDVWGFGRWICGRFANFVQQKCYFAGSISRGSDRSLYASAQPFRGSAVLLKHPLKNR